MNTNEYINYLAVRMINEELTENSQIRNLAVGYSIQSIKRNAKRFFSTTKKIDLNTEAFNMGETDGDFKFTVKGTMFEGLDDQDVKMSLKNSNEDVPYPWFKVGVNGGNMYSFVPSTVDLIKFCKLINLKNIKRNLYTKINNSSFNMADSSGRTIFELDLNESMSEINESTINPTKEFYDIINRELRKIESGNSYKHQNTKIGRIEALKKTSDGYDIGNIIYHWYEKSKNEGHGNEERDMFLTDKAIQIGLAEDKTLVEIAFKDPYGLGKVMNYLNDVEQIPMSLVDSAMENQKQGLSTTNNETSRF